MLINLGEQLRKYNIHPNGIIHVGAHWCEEHEEYVSYGCNSFFYIEPCKKAFEIMKNKFNSGGLLPGEGDFVSYGWMNKNKDFGSISLWNGACGEKEDKMVMYVSHQNQGQSNSLLEPDGHLTQHPEIVFDDAELVNVLKLDTVCNKHLFSLTLNTEEKNKRFNVLCIDVQGYEGEVLKGATETLKHIDVVYTEVNKGSTYKNNALIEKIDELLSDFTRVETYWPSPNWTWGDAIYIRKTLL